MKNFNVSIEIANVNYEVLPGKYYGKDLYSKAGISSDSYMLLLDVAEEIDIPVEPENLVILTGGERFVVSEHDTEIESNPSLITPLSFEIDGMLYEGQNAFSKAKITTEELQSIIGKVDEELRIILDLDGIADQVISSHHEIVVGKNWRLLTTPVTDENTFVDLENNGKNACPTAHYYQIRINNEKYKVDVPHMLGRDILILAGKDPEQNSLYQMLRGGGADIVEANEKVDFTAPGIERFTTIPLDMTEGLSASDARREFQLSEIDRGFLDSLNLAWEAVLEGQIRRIIIHDFPLPEGYNAKTTMVNMRLEVNYPTTQIDMAYFFPGITRNDNVPIRATTIDSFDGKQWQRWSRHRTLQNPWRPGIDNISTHVAAIQSWLVQELHK